MSAASTRVRLSSLPVTAPAKVNLALHVTGRRGDDGYHTLSSLVAFTADGDRLKVAAARADAFMLTGAFADALHACAPGDNLVVRALAAARAIAARAGMDFGPLAIRLEKTLPVASGIGGGSADAAALLRLVADACPELAGALRAAGLRLGADVPMCFDGVPALLEGIGDVATPLRRFPPLPCVLVNPGVPVATPEVFRRLSNRANPPLPELPADGFAGRTALVGYLRATRNDLEAPAAEIAPAIAGVREALMTAGARFARMSGSGPTVFGLFETTGEAEAAAGVIAARQPRWWIMPTRLMPAGERGT